ncbi:MAG TPA: FUSC family protein [Candidatus Acidoferrum sp.]|nr:FUSC family protein [Candidatus Acidoferrum sp.]
MRETVRLDRSGLEWRYGLRCTIGIAIPLILATLVGQPLSGVSGAIGALAAGFASRQGVHRTRAAAMVLTSGAMALSAFVGSMTGMNPVLSVALLTVWGGALGFLEALGAAATAVGVNSVVALVVFSHPPFGPALAVMQALLVFAGGVLQTILLVLVWPLQRFSAERRVLADAYRALGSYAGNLPHSKLGPPASASLTAVSDALADPQPFGRRDAMVIFESLLDAAQRIRGSLAALASDRHLLELHDALAAANAVEDVGAHAEAIMLEIATALEGGRAPVALDPHWHAADQAMLTLERERNALPSGSPAALDAGQAIEDGRAFLGQLRTAWRAGQVSEDRAGASPLRPRAVQPFGVTQLGLALDTLRANLTFKSAYAQHAIRLAATLTIAGIIEHLLALERGYWIPMTAVLVLRPDFTSTLTRGGGRVGGTVAGAIIAGFIVAMIRPGPEVYVILSILSAALTFTVFKVNYGVFTIAITLYVVFLLALGGAPEHRAAADRVLATLLGGTLALLMYVVWPTWSRERVATELAELLDAQRRLASLVLRAYLSPQQVPERMIRHAQLEAWLARSNAEATIDRMATEPVRPRAITLRAALGLLAASRRYGIASLTLQSRLGRSVDVAQLAIEKLIDELDTSMRAIGRALRDDTDLETLPRLRDAQAALKRAYDETPESSLAALVSETDLLVDSVEMMAGILHRLHTVDE